MYHFFWKKVCKSYELHHDRIPNAALFVRSIVGILGWLHGTSRGGSTASRVSTESLFSSNTKLWRHMVIRHSRSWPSSLLLGLHWSHFCGATCVWFWSLYRLRSLCFVVDSCDTSRCVSCDMFASWKWRSRGKHPTRLVTAKRCPERGCWCS